jgi:hypothetical protein
MIGGPFARTQVAGFVTKKLFVCDRDANPAEQYEQETLAVAVRLCVPRGSGMLPDEDAVDPVELIKVEKSVPSTLTVRPVKGPLAVTATLTGDGAKITALSAGEVTLNDAQPASAAEITINTRAKNGWCKDARIGR